MAQWADKTPTGERRVQLPAGIALKPPVSIEDLKADTEYDPEGAEEFVAFIRAARQGIHAKLESGENGGGVATA